MARVFCPKHKNLHTATVLQALDSPLDSRPHSPPKSANPARQVEWYSPEPFDPL